MPSSANPSFEALVEEIIALSSMVADMLKSHNETITLLTNVIARQTSLEGDFPKDAEAGKLLKS